VAEYGLMAASLMRNMMGVIRLSPVEVVVEANGMELSENQLKSSKVV
jgi:hypothetical protein